MDLTLICHFFSVPGSRPNAYDVHFDVAEKNLLKGGLQTQFDANSANMVCVSLASRPQQLELIRI